jgi:hypothetical protein
MHPDCVGVYACCAYAAPVARKMNVIAARISMRFAIWTSLVIEIAGPLYPGDGACAILLNAVSPAMAPSNNYQMV